MSSFPIERYRFYRNDDTIIAVSTYGGRYVKGYAKCSEQDEFNEEFGKKLAAARCNDKVANKRAAYAKLKLDKAIEALEQARRNFRNAYEYYEDAEYATVESMMEVKDLTRKA